MWPAAAAGSQPAAPATAAGATGTTAAGGLGREAAAAPAAASAAPAATAGPVVTAVGSSNFGFRSLRRDLEVQFLVITKNRGLQQVSVGGRAGDRVVAVFVRPQLPLLRSRLLPAISAHTAMQSPQRPSCCRRWAERRRSCGSTAKRWQGRPTFERPAAGAPTWHVRRCVCCGGSCEAGNAASGKWPAEGGVSTAQRGTALSLIHVGQMTCCQYR
jgi:hypothetical protein